MTLEQAAQLAYMSKVAGPSPSMWSLVHKAPTVAGAAPSMRSLAHKAPTITPAALKKTLQLGPTGPHGTKIITTSPAAAAPTQAAAATTTAAEAAGEAANAGISTPMLVGGGAALGLGGYMLGSRSKQAEFLQQTTFAAFEDELAKLAFFRRPPPINIIVQHPEMVASNAVKALPKGAIGMNAGTLGVLGVGGAGAIVGANALKDWQAGRQMRQQMGG
jgi:hypothetical protein